MLKLLARNIDTIERRLVLVAPPVAALPASLRNVVAAPDQRAGLVREVQRMRGAAYLADGAIQPHELTADGLHQTPEDAHSWHLLFVNPERRVTACVWYRQHDADVSFEDLRARYCPLAFQPEWGARLWYAVESELARARRDGLRYAEVGGWAVAKESRGASEGLLLALAVYSLGHELGGALGMAAATVRHSSSTILRELGGSRLQSGDDEILPPYYDPKYRCFMELLRFDSRLPNAKYASLIEMIRQKLACVPIVASEFVCQPASAVPKHAQWPQHPVSP